MFLFTAIIPPLASSYGTFTGNQQYGDSLCHDTESTLSVTLESSPAFSSNLSKNQTVTIWMNVTGAISSDIVGGLIASSTGSTGSLPTENGWTIVSDPSNSGSTYNYFKFSNYIGSAVFKWVLDAPASDGSYPIYGRVLHKDGGAQYFKNAGPVIFSVGTGGSGGGGTTILFNSISENSVIHGQMVLNMTIVPALGVAIEKVTLFIDGVEISEREESPFAWSIDTSAYVDGNHTLTVEVTDSNDNTTYKTITVAFDNEALERTRNNFIWTTISGTLAIFAVGSMMIMLMSRSSRKGGAS